MLIVVRGEVKKTRIPDNREKILGILQGGAKVVPELVIIDVQRENFFCFWQSFPAKTRV
jgi:hypothetical protein